ncbi:transglycosylase SLT domain-containing protein [Rhodobacterales bacterium HKCCE3408]|nr:transglycosylase SLT domain-containing protein [Rhodobacterales bacterium HKCCE3408]
MRQAIGLLAAGLCLACVTAASAQMAPGVTFRRVAAPEPGHTGPLINIQIEPQPEAPDVPEEEVADLPDDTGPVSDAALWFWAGVPAGLEAPGRLDTALRRLAEAAETRELGLLRLDDLNRMAAAHGREILAATAGTRVSPALVLAVMAVESAGRADAVSGAGAQGLMQLIPATAERFGVADPFDPVQNIQGGVAYLDWLLGEFGQDAVLALAGYNAGEGAVWRAGGVPDYTETREYVPKVLATWEIARGLCLTRPELISDGCVFATMAGG